jgi:hypothetical protein
MEVSIQPPPPPDTAISLKNVHVRV